MANLRVKKTSRRIRKQVKEDCISPNEPVLIKVVEQQEAIVSVTVKHGLVEENLPKPTFRLVSSFNEEEEKQEEEEDDESDDEVEEVVFERPENHYIRYIEPTDKELYERVEYDMDEQDQVYLSLLNNDRRKEGLSNITPYTFECVMDRLEKEWYNLVKDLPKEVPDHHHHNTTILPEDSACAICDDTEVENSNAIVFCDGCNVAVHQDCYGIPYIPEGQWLCRKCMISPENPVSCIFCPNEGGAFKQTVTNQWGHLLCAIWIPEVGVSNTIYMEPIDMIENIPKSRFNLCCFICKKKKIGACIQCDNKYCFTAFHVTCARSVKLCMKMSNETGLLKAFCDRHTPKDYQEEILLVNQDQDGGGGRKSKVARKRGKKVKEEKEKEEENTMTIAETKAARAHQHHYSTGIPIAPDEMLARLDNLSCLKTIRLKQRMQIVNEICHYWSLKRETRRGAPLIKRLHLEPWTANLSRIVDQRNKHSAMLNLRVDLEKIRMLAEQVKKREKLKLDISKKQHDYLETIYFPMDAILTTCLQQFIQLDKKQHLFTPDDDNFISQKIKTHHYQSINEFKYDISTIWENVIEKNQTKTQEYRLALRLKAAAPPLFEEADKEWLQMKLVQGTTSLNIPVNDAIFNYDVEPLEFPMEDWDKMEEEQKARELVEAEEKKKAEEMEQAERKEKEEKEGERKAGIEKRTNARRSEKRAVDRKVLEEEKATLNEEATSTDITTTTTTTDIVEVNSKIEDDDDDNTTEIVENNSSAEGTTEIVQDNSKSAEDTTEIMEDDSKSSGITTTIDNSKSAAEKPTEIPQDNSKSVEKSTETTTQDNNKTTKSVTEITQDNNSKTTEVTSNNKKSASSSIPKKRRRPTLPVKRTTRSQGIVASLNELKARKGRMSKESKELYNSYIGASAESREKLEYVEDRGKHAPPGWMYVRSESDNDDKEEEKYEEEMEVVDDNVNNVDEMKTTDKEKEEVDIDVDKDEKMKTTDKEEEEEGDIDVGDDKEEEVDAEEEGDINIDDDKEDDNNDGDESNVPKKKRKYVKYVPKKVGLTPKNIDDIKSGDIVWTRRRLHPFLAAKIFESKDEGVPSSILQSNNKSRITYTIAEFYNVEEEIQWSWVKLEDVFELGNPDSDEILLDDTFSRPWKYKDQRILELWEGYKTACHLKGIDPTLAMLKIQQKYPKRRKQIDILLQSASSSTQ